MGSEANRSHSLVNQCATSATSGGSRASVTGDSQIPTWRRGVPTRANLFLGSSPRELTPVAASEPQVVLVQSNCQTAHVQQSVEGSQVGCLDS